jgi:hypothetical protein
MQKRGLTSVSSRRRHTRLLGEVVGVVIVLVGPRALRAAEAPVVSTPTVYRRETFKAKHARGEEKHLEDYWTYLVG